MASLDDFFTALCRRMGWEPTTWRLNVLKTMAQMEGTGLQAWNPLDTMHPFGATGNWNSAGVKVYPNQAAGVEATARTLEQPNFTNLRNTFRDQKVNQGTAADLATWGWAQGSDLSNTILGAMGGKGAAGASTPMGRPIAAVNAGPAPAEGFSNAGQGQDMGPPDPDSPRYYGTKQVQTGTDEISPIYEEQPDPAQFNYSLYNQDFQSWKEATGQLQDTSDGRAKALADYLDTVIASINADISGQGLNVSQASNRLTNKINAFDIAAQQYTALQPYTIPKGVEYIPGFGPGEFGAQYGGPVKATPQEVNPFASALQFLGQEPEPAGVDTSALQSPEFQQALDYLRQYGMGGGGDNGGYNLTPTYGGGNGGAVADPEQAATEAVAGAAGVTSARSMLATILARIFQQIQGLPSYTPAPSYTPTPTMTSGGFTRNLPAGGFTRNLPAGGFTPSNVNKLWRIVNQSPLLGGIQAKNQRTGEVKTFDNATWDTVKDLLY